MGRATTWMACALCLVWAALPSNARGAQTLPEGAHVERLLIDKSTHRSSVFDGDLLLTTYAVALGRGGPGALKIYHIVRVDLRPREACARTRACAASGCLIQAEVLALRLPPGSEPVTERHLRQVLESPIWGEQRVVWRSLRASSDQ